MTEEVKRLYRSREERMVAGVCGGLAEFTNLDPTIVRLLFVGVSILGAAPGMVLAEHGGRPSDLNDGFDNFAVISCEVSAIDWLFLRADGHLRARFDWNSDHWSGKWIAP